MAEPLAEDSTRHLSPTSWAGQFQLLRFCWVLSRAYPAQVAFVFGISLLATIFEVAVLFTIIPLLQKFVEGQIVGNPLLRDLFAALGVDQLSLLQVGVLISLLLLAKALLRFLAAYVTGTIAARIEYEKKQQILSNYVSANWIHLVQVDSGKLVNVVGPETGHVGAIVHYFSNLMVATLYCTALLINLLVFYTEVAPLLIGAFGLSLLMGMEINRRSVVVSFERLGVTNYLTGLFIELTQSIKFVKTLPDRSVVLNEIFKTAAKYRRLVVVQFALKAASSQAAEVIGVLVIAGLFVGSTFFSFVKLGDLLLIVLLLQRTVGQVSALQRWARQTISVIPSYDIVENLNSDLTSNGETPTRDGPKAEPLRAIELRQLQYAYPNNHTPNVQDVSCTISPGEMVAIVGPSGSGKTTLIDLLTGLIPPQSGEIRVNDQPLNYDDMQTWRRRVSYVPQTSIVFAGSVRDNITRFASDDHVWPLERALFVSCADEFVSELNDKVDTAIRERGSNLSGGQCQRLAIARGLYSSPEVLVLDEATSALDAQTERLFWTRLRENLGDMAVIFTTHRLSNLEFADKVVVMNEGRAEAVGHPGEIESLSSTMAVLRSTRQQ